MGKVLVVGGAGYLGRHVADLLGKRAVVYDNLLYSSDYFEPHEFIYGDVTNSIRLSLALKKHEYDAVIWLAAIVGDAACALDPARAMAVNVDSVRWLASKYNGRIIYVSTCSVYGATQKPATELSLPEPLSIYAETKLKAEQCLVDRKALIFRLGTLHGVSKRMRFDLMVNAMTLSAYSEGVVTVFGGMQKRPLLHVRDAANTIVTMTCPENRHFKSIYNLASENVRVCDVGHAIPKIVPDAKVGTRAIETEDKRDYGVDWTLAQKRLRFAPRYSWLESVKSIYELLKSGRIKNPSDSRYYNIKALGGCSGT